MGDEAPAHIEFEATNERDVAPTGHGAPGQGVSASRVVREPGRWSRLVVVVAVVGSLAGGLFWWVGDLGPDDGLSSGSASDTRPTRVAFHEAVFRRQNLSFAYEGEVHAAEQSAFRPGDWTARDVTVEGAVLMSHGLTRDVAVDATGRAVETVTSGPTVWIRALEGPAECLRLALSYRDPGAVAQGFMTLRVTTPTCGWVEQGDGEPEPLTAGSFEGTVVQAASGLGGDLLNGTTRVGFLTDLSTEDAATLLASLRPFDPEREPTSLAGVPSD